MIWLLVNCWEFWPLILRHRGGVGEDNIKYMEFDLTQRKLWFHPVFRVLAPSKLTFSLISYPLESLLISWMTHAGQACQINYHSFSRLCSDSSSNDKTQAVHSYQLRPNLEWFYDCLKRKNYSKRNQEIRGHYGHIFRNKLSWKTFLHWRDCRPLIKSHCAVQIIEILSLLVCNIWYWFHWHTGR